MKRTFSKSTRLLSRLDYQTLYKRGERWVNKNLLVFYSLESGKGRRLGITISKKWGTSPLRNRFKRIVRAAFREVYPDLPPQIDLNIHPRAPLSALKTSDLVGELKKFVERICVSSQSQAKTSR